MSPNTINRVTKLSLYNERNISNLQ